MAKVYLNRETFPAFKERIGKLSPEAERQFGTMSVIAMMRHMRNVMETALGETSYPKQLPEFIGIQRQILARWRHEGVGPVWVSLGRRIFYRSSDLRSWIESRARHNTIAA